MTAAQELEEAGGWLETYGYLPEGLATPAVRAVAEPMLPGEVVDIVLALQQAARQLGESDTATARDEALRDVLRAHHPVMRSETGPFAGCRCGGVGLGQDVIAHVVAHLGAALDAAPDTDNALRGVLADLVEAVSRGDEVGLPEAYRAACAALRGVS